MVVSIMGILKAGAAYLPLDPKYPKDRLDYIVNDSGLQLVLIASDTQQVFEDISSRKLVKVFIDKADFVQGCIQNNRFRHIVHRQVTGDQRCVFAGHFDGGRGKGDKVAL